MNIKKVATKSSFASRVVKKTLPMLLLTVNQYEENIKGSSIENTDKKNVNNKNDNTASLSQETKLKPNRFFSQNAVKILKKWFYENISYPYPDEQTTNILAQEANISTKQVRKWFANKRVRSNKCFKQIYKNRRQTAAAFIANEPYKKENYNTTNNYDTLNISHFNEGENLCIEQIKKSLTSCETTIYKSMQKFDCDGECDRNITHHHDLSMLASEDEKENEKKRLLNCLFSQFDLYNYLQSSQSQFKLEKLDVFKNFFLAYGCSNIKTSSINIFNEICTNSLMFSEAFSNELLNRNCIQRNTDFIRSNGFINQEKPFEFAKRINYRNILDLIS